MHLSVGSSLHKSKQFFKAGVYRIANVNDPSRRVFKRRFRAGQRRVCCTEPANIKSQTAPPRIKTQHRVAAPQNSPLSRRFEQQNFWGQSLTTAHEAATILLGRLMPPSTCTHPFCHRSAWRLFARTGNTGHSGFFRRGTEVSCHELSAIQLHRCKPPGPQQSVV